MLSEEGAGGRAEEPPTTSEEDLHFILSEHIDNLSDKRCVCVCVCVRVCVLERERVVGGWKRHCVTLSQLQDKASCPLQYDQHTASEDSRPSPAGLVSSSCPFNH